MWQFFRRYRVVLDTWRDDFAEWLSHCYDDPERYIESTPDRHAAGEPDRTRPQYLLQHNGSRGASRYGGEECGDRRTWTWEIRVEQPVSMSDAAVVQVGFADFEVAQDFADEIEERTGRRPHIHTLDRDAIPSQDSLYRDSQNVLTWMMSNEGQTTSH